MISKQSKHSFLVLCTALCLGTIIFSGCVKKERIVVHVGDGSVGCVKLD